MMLFLLLIRPSIDVFRNFGLKFGPVATLNLNAIFAILIIILGSLFILIQRKSFLNNQVSKFFLFYLIFTLVWGVSVSTNRMNFFATFLRELSFFIVFSLSFQLFNKDKQIKNLTIVCIMSSLVPIVVASQQAIKRGFKFPLYIRPAIEGVHPGIQGTFSHPSGLGIYLMLILLISFGFMLTRVKRINIAKWITVTGILYFFLILTYFRTAWVGLLGALVIISIVKYRRLLFPILLVALISLTVAPSIIQRARQLTSWYWRIRLWTRLLLLGGNKLDYIFGRGLGSMSILLHNIWGLGIVTAHGTYLKIFFETGILGVFLFLYIKLLVLRKAFFLIGEDNSQYVRSVAIAVFGMTISLFIAYTSQTIVGPAVMWYYWVYAGALFGMEYKLRGKESFNFSVDRK